MPPYYNIPSLRQALLQIVQAIDNTFNSGDASAHMGDIEPQFVRFSFFILHNHSMY